MGCAQEKGRRVVGGPLACGFSNLATAGGRSAGVALAASAAAHQGQLAALRAWVALVALESGQADPFLI